MEGHSPLVTIRLIKCFEGLRHTWLEAIWDTIAEYVAPAVNVRVFNNPGARLSHAQCYNRMWAEEREFNNRLVCFTEYDFLPNLHNPDWLGLEEFGGAIGWGAEYRTRSPYSRQLIDHEYKLGGWFFVLDKEQVGDADLNFDGDPDPANQIPMQLAMEYGADADFLLIVGTDAYPRHTGIDYEFGTHLFWSRHYNDDPSGRLCGLSKREILTKVDREIVRWLRSAPTRFRKLFVHRFGSADWVSSYDSIDGPLISKGSLTRSGRSRRKVGSKPSL